MAKESELCTDVDDLVKHYFLPVGYSLVFIGGLLGNTTAIVVYVLKFHPWKSSSIIMVNLSVIDLLFALSMPYLVYYYSNGDQWALGDFMCRFARFVFHFNLYGSIMSLMCIAVFQYVVVMRPLWTPWVQQKHWGLLASAVVWIRTAAEVTPILTLIDMREGDNQTYCLDFASTTDVDAICLYSLLITAFGYVLPLLVVFICYIRIVVQLHKGPQTSSTSQIRSQRVAILILVVFVLCFLPYHILRALRIETRNMPHLSCTLRNTVHAAYIISKPLAAFNTFFNLVLFTLLEEVFKKAFVSVFSCQRWLRKSTSLVNLAFISPACPALTEQRSNSSTLTVP
ncbi:2-oxoglutarate receptor 1-like [Boleophthalmus pectinirostris]|uniref:2-oxoglutarate receptor 1-like n=1 Tax=Boleophthalmus pectinirostris TaxID=150288 RepID=UPI000A1C3E20|nr:2-oxoglutarate receptor 1-like [Boleophthalmus pectinirostris]